MTLKPLALVLELIALVLFVSAFLAAPIRWDFIAVGAVMVAAAIFIRKRHGDQ